MTYEWWRTQALGHCLPKQFLFFHVRLYISILLWFCFHYHFGLSYEANQERCRHAPAVGVQRLRNNQTTETCWSKQLVWGIGSTFYKHLKSPYPDVFSVSNDTNEGYTGIVMSCVYVIGNKKTKWKRFRVLRLPVGVNALVQLAASTFMI